MSHTAIYAKPSSISAKKEKGFVKPKKGVKVLCSVDRHEGDDEDGIFDRVLTIAQVKRDGDYYLIRYAEILHDNWNEIYGEFYIKEEK